MPLKKKLSVFRRKSRHTAKTCLIIPSKNDSRQVLAPHSQTRCRNCPRYHEGKAFWIISWGTAPTCTVLIINSMFTVCVTWFIHRLQWGGLWLWWWRRLGGNGTWRTSWDEWTPAERSQTPWSPAHPAPLPPACKHRHRKWVHVSLSRRQRGTLQRGWTLPNANILAFLDDPVQRVIN